MRKGDEDWVNKCMEFKLKTDWKTKKDMVRWCRSGYGRT